MNSKSRYLSSAFLLVLSSVVVKIIGAVYKIPLTSFIGAVGRGYFAVAYNLYLPIHAIILGAFPVALSKLVSKYNANQNTPMLYGLKKASKQVFFFAGLIGMSLLLVASIPYSKYIASSPKSVYTILVLAPSVLFSSLSACYQDYYKGLMDMKPTAISQTLDALFKMIFGLLFAKISMSYLYNEYVLYSTVMGKIVNDDSVALSVIYPYTSAFAMLGAFFGSIVSFVFVSVYDVINKDRNTNYKNIDIKASRNELLSFSFPIMLSCAVQSLFQFLDTASVQLALGFADTNALKLKYDTVGIATSDLVTYAYGLFSTSLDFRNLIIGVTMSLGVCAVPAISRECELKNCNLSKLINSIYKYTSLLSLYGGTMISLYSKEILSLFYSNSPDIVQGCSKLVQYFGMSVIVYSLSGTAINSVQAVGLPEKSIKPYIVSGIVRVFLNVILVKNSNLLLNGAVISGAVGYLIMCVWNILIVRKYTKTEFNVVSVLIKPALISLITYLSTYFLLHQITISMGNITNLLIKIALSTLIFCILCFSLKSLKFNLKILHSK